MKTAMMIVCCVGTCTAFGQMFGDQHSQNNRIFGQGQERNELTARELSPVHGVGCTCIGCMNTRADMSRKGSNDETSQDEGGSGFRADDSFLPSRIGRKPRATMNEHERREDDFDYAFGGKLHSALYTIRSRMRSGQTGWLVIVPADKNSSSFANMNAEADLFAREYAVRKFVNKSTTAFIAAAKNSSIGPHKMLTAKDKNFLCSAYKEGIAKAKKQYLSGVKSFEFPKELLTPVAIKGID